MKSNHATISEAPNDEAGVSSEINLKGIAIFVIAVIFLVAFSLSMIKLVLPLNSETKNNPSSFLTKAPVAGAGRPNFPEPREQVVPREDLRVLQKRDVERLNSYGWVDANAGIIHIPIERAMELLVSRPSEMTTASKMQSNLELQQQRATQRPPDNQEGKQ